MTSFLDEIERKSGEKISACYQCYRCTNGCPVVIDMDVFPHRIIRYIILGDRDKVLKSKAIWQCLQCATCSVRCPNDIDIAHVFDTLRRVSIEEGMAIDTDIWRFDRLFLESVKRHGRLYEIEAIMRYKLEKKELFRDTKMGAKMMLKGRMGVMPHSIRGKKQIRSVFEKLD